MWTKRCNPDNLGYDLAFICHKTTLCDLERKRALIIDISDESYYPWKFAKIKRRARYQNKFPPLRR